MRHTETRSTPSGQYPLPNQNLLSGQSFPRNASLNSPSESVPDVIRYVRSGDADAFLKLLPELLEHGTHWITAHFRAEIREAVTRVAPLPAKATAHPALEATARIYHSLLDAGISVDTSRDKPLLTESLISTYRKHFPNEAVALTRSAIGANLDISPFEVTSSIIAGLRTGIHATEFRQIDSLIDVAVENSHLDTATSGINASLATAFTRALRWSLDHSYSRESAERLGLLSHSACKLLSHGLKTEVEVTNPITTERFINELQRTAPNQAAELCRYALRQGYSLNPSTVLFTAIRCVETAHTVSDLSYTAKLAVDALDYGALDTGDQKVIDTYNGILARFCTPQLTSTRISPDFVEESDLFDVAQRLRLGLDVASAVSRSHLCFVSEENESRMNMTIRALCTIGCALNLESLRISEHLTDKEARGIQDSIRFPFQYPPISPEHAQHPEILPLAHELVRGALDLAHRSAYWQDEVHIPGRVFERFKLNGATVNALLVAIEGSEISLNDFDALKLVQTMEKAAAIRQTRIRLFSHSISAGLTSILDAENVSPVVKAYTAARMSTAVPGLTLDKSALQRTWALQKELNPEQDISVSDNGIERMKQAFELPEKQAGKRASHRSNHPGTAPSAPRLPWFSRLLHEAGYFREQAERTAST